MKLIIITGATKGLGLAISKRLLNNGYSIVGVARSITNEFAELVKNHQGNCFFKAYDFLNTDGISQFANQLSKEYGVAYGLINNAAVGYDGVLATMHDSQINDLLKINVNSPILLTKYISRKMLIKKQGRVINISSIIASTGFNGLSVYAASKSALTGFTRSLARELGKSNITVNTLSPGYMETEMTNALQGDKLASIRRRSPLGHLASVDDVAATAVFLLSDDAKNITGATFTVDAGSTA